MELLQSDKNKRILHNSGIKGQTEKSHNKQSQKLLNNRYPHSTSAKNIMSYFTHEQNLIVGDDSFSNLLNLKSTQMQAVLERANSSMVHGQMDSPHLSARQRESHHGVYTHPNHAGDERSLSQITGANAATSQLTMNNKNASETNIFHSAYSNLSHQPPSIPTLQNAWRRQNQPHFALTIRQIGSNTGTNVNMHSGSGSAKGGRQTWSQKNAPKAYYWN